MPVLGKRDMQFRKQKREWVVATRLGSMHLGRRQNKGWGGVSQIKKNLIRIPLRKKEGLCACIGEERYAIQKTKTGMGCCN